jgi:hypothetical protein
MKEGKTLEALVEELDRQNAAKQDFLAGTDELVMRVKEDGTTRLEFADNSFRIGCFAHSQIAAATEIPERYYNKMLKEKPDLLTANVNEWFHKKPTRRMVRTLDGTVRALLSDRYRRIDNMEVFEAAQPAI